MSARAEVGASPSLVDARANSSLRKALPEESQIDFGGFELRLDRPQQRDLRLRTQDEAGLPEAAPLPPRR